MARIIIDGNSLGYSNHCGVKLTQAGFETQAIFGFIKTMRAIKVDNLKGSDIVLWDGHAQWRYDLFPGYKAGRDKDPKQALMRANYKKARPFIQLAFQHLGIRQIAISTGEADDMAGYLVSTLGKGEKIELITGDKDWLMLVKDGVTWFDPIRDSKVNTNNFFDFTGYVDGRAFLEGKALQGDSSDKIDGVGGIGEKGAPEFLAQFKSVENFFNRVDSGEYVPKKKAEQRFGFGKSELSLEEFSNLHFAEHEKSWEGNGRALFKRNYQLMNLIDIPKPKPEDVVYIKPTFDKEKFRLICERFNFASMLVNFDNFVRPFEESAGK